MTGRIVTAGTGNRTVSAVATSRVTTMPAVPAPPLAGSASSMMVGAGTLTAAAFARMRRTAHLAGGGSAAAH